MALSVCCDDEEEPKRFNNTVAVHDISTRTRCFATESNGNGLFLRRRCYIDVSLLLVFASFLPLLLLLLLLFSWSSILKNTWRFLFCLLEAISSSSSSSSLLYYLFFCYFVHSSCNFAFVPTLDTISVLAQNVNVFYCRNCCVDRGFLAPKLLLAITEKVDFWHFPNMTHPMISNQFSIKHLIP